MSYGDNRKKKLVGYTFDEWEIVEKKAKAVNINTTDYIRRISVSGEVKQYDSTEIRKLMLALNRYGNNLNQIARVANESGSIFRTDIEEIKKEFYHIKGIAYDCFYDFAVRDNK